MSKQSRKALLLARQLVETREWRTRSRELSRES